MNTPNSQVTEQSAVLRFLRDDSLAATFQTLGQYRKAAIEAALTARTDTPAAEEGFVSEEMKIAGARSLIDGQDNRPGSSWADEAELAYRAMLAAAGVAK